MPTIRSLARTALLIAGLLPGISARTADADSLFDWGLPLARKDSVEGVGPFWAVPFTKKLVEAGDTLWVVSRLDIAAHHYAYAEKTSASIGEIDGVWVGEAIASLPEIKFDRFQNREVPQYVGSAVYRIPLVPAAAVAPRELTAQLTLRTMGCSETVCYLQMSEERTVTFEYVPPSDTDVEGSGFTKLGADEPGATGLGGMLAERGMLLALGLMFLGGLLTSFTPCVYPVIPFTISFFGASRAGALRGFALSGVFVLGMATMYSALGVAAAATGAVFGTVMSNPIVIGVIAALFLAFAASMFGAFKIQLGGSAQKRLESVGGASIGGAFLAGLVAGVIAAPCTGPVLGSALAYVATTGDLVFGFFSMFAFALGMGMLFMAIGTFSANIVPKSGPWLDKVESAFGIVMISAALYFLKDVVPPLKEAMVLGNTALIVSLLLVSFIGNNYYQAVYAEDLFFTFNNVNNCQGVRSYGHYFANEFNNCDQGIENTTSITGSLYINNNHFIGGYDGINVDDAYVEISDNYFEGCDLDTGLESSGKVFNNIINEGNVRTSAYLDVYQNIGFNGEAGITITYRNESCFNNLSINNQYAFNGVFSDYYNNCIFLGNDELSLNGVHGNPIFRNCILDFDIEPPCIDGGGNIIIDSLQAQTLFEDILNGDFHLIEGSPAIDAGFDTLSYYTLTLLKNSLNIKFKFC